MDIVEKSDQDSATLIANYQRLRKEQTPAFAALLAERDRRAAGKDQLDLALSLEAFKAAAKEHRYVTYGDLSQASGQTWNHTIRARMSGLNGHLDRMLDVCHQQDLPLLTALCVNQKNRKSGELDAFSRTGFYGGAKRLGLLVTDEETFYRRCQQECFDWGRRQKSLS
jgi:hypothetical protein